MAFNARVYRFLIASPSDVSEERDVVVRAIQDWNNRNAAELAVTVLPVRWETHSRPDFGRPQSLLNDQIVDGCDALIGVFWTRIGTSTGIAESGTLEEIERTVAAGKPAMLYFSSAPQSPDHIDVDQLVKLRGFRSAVQNRALVQTYRSVDEFKELVVRHIEAQVRQLMTDETGVDTGGATSPQADIEVRLDGQAMKLDGVAADGLTGHVTTKFVTIAAPETIPDFVSSSSDEASTNPGSLGLLAGAMTLVNVNYYREVAAWLRDGAAFRKLGLAIRNAGTMGARDVYFEVEIVSDKPISVVQEKDLVLSRPATTNAWSANKVVAVHERSETWELKKDVGSMQPQRTIDLTFDAFIGAWEDCTISVHITIYADILSTPTRRLLTLEWTTSEKVSDVAQLTRVLNKRQPANDGSEVSAD